MRWLYIYLVWHILERTRIVVKVFVRVAALAIAYDALIVRSHLVSQLIDRLQLMILLTIRELKPLITGECRVFKSAWKYWRLIIRRGTRLRLGAGSLWWLWENFAEKLLAYDRLALPNLLCLNSLSRRLGWRHRLLKGRAHYWWRCRIIYWLLVWHEFLVHKRRLAISFTLKLKLL